MKWIVFRLVIGGEEDLNKHYMKLDSICLQDMNRLVDAIQNWPNNVILSDFV